MRSPEDPRCVSSTRSAGVYGPAEKGPVHASGWYNFRDAQYWSAGQFGLSDLPDIAYCLGLTTDAAKAGPAPAMDGRYRDPGGERPDYEIYRRVTGA